MLLDACFGAIPLCPPLLVLIFLLSWRPGARTERSLGAHNEEKGL